MFYGEGGAAMSYQPMMSPWLPQAYSLGSRRRYAQYPTFVRTSIPGAGFNRNLVMASQPLMLNGMGDGLGVNPMDVVNVAAGLISNPDATLRARGPAIVAALETHILGPAIDSAAKKAAPYAFKYVLPPLAFIMITSALGAWFGYKVAQKIGA